MLSNYRDGLTEGGGIKYFEYHRESGDMHGVWVLHCYAQCSMLSTHYDLGINKLSQDWGEALKLAVGVVARPHSLHHRLFCIFADVSNITVGLTTWSRVQIDRLIMK